MSERNQAWYVAEILASARIIQKEVAGLEKSEFLASQTARDAVCFRFIALGHAAAQITEETREKLVDIPFDLVRGMRNVLAHDYTAIDYARVWRTATESIPQLIECLEPIVESDLKNLQNDAEAKQAGEL